MSLISLKKFSFPKEVVFPGIQIFLETKSQFQASKCFLELTFHFICMSSPRIHLKVNFDKILEF